MNINMESFVSKLRNTVTQVAYQVNSSVNTIIPGNLIHREYETLKLRCTQGCPGFVWNVYDAIKRDSASIKASLKDAIGPGIIPNSDTLDSSPNLNGSTSNSDKQLYSVFVFDKSQLDRLPKNEREAIIEHLKNGVMRLTRLRHPAILTIHHPLEESRSSLAYVTEHVYGHLDSILKEQRGKRIKTGHNLSKDLVDLSQDFGPKDSDYQGDSCELDEIQIKAGLLQVCDGLKFLHNDAKMIHRNLCLDNIFVDSNNTWKIAGFEFSCNQLSLKPTSDSQIPSDSLQIVEFDSKAPVSPLFSSLKTIYPQLPASIVPNWSCSAPEHSNLDQVTYSSDVYSLGILSCALLGNDTDMVDLSYEYGMISDTYKRGIYLRELADKLQMSIKGSIMKYATINTNSRQSLEEYPSLAIFNDPQVQAIRDLDSQFAWDRLKKIDFFNRLRDILPKLSHQVKVNRIAKSLFTEIVNPEMLPYVLPNILIIAKDSTPTEFKAKIFPHLKAPFRVLEPRSVPLMLMDNMVTLANRSKLCLPEFQQSAFTLIQYLLRMDQQLQEKCLSILPTVKTYIDERSLQELIIPELNRLMRETSNSSIRVRCLKCLGELVEVMNPGTVINRALPMIFEIPFHDIDAVMVAIGIVKLIVYESRANVGSEVVATKILPFLTPLSILKDLDSSRCSTLMALIRSLLDKIEMEQKRTNRVVLKDNLFHESK